LIRLAVIKCILGLAALSVRRNRVLKKKRKPRVDATVGFTMIAILSLPERLVPDYAYRKRCCPLLVMGEGALKGITVIMMTSGARHCVHKDDIWQKVVYNDFCSIFALNKQRRYIIR
jgi:hypothetical protein